MFQVYPCGISDQIYNSLLDIMNVSIVARDQHVEEWYPSNGEALDGSDEMMMYG